MSGEAARAPLARWKGGCPSTQSQRAQFRPSRPPLPFSRFLFQLTSSKLGVSHSHCFQETERCSASKKQRGD